MSSLINSHQRSPLSISRRKKTIYCAIQPEEQRLFLSYFNRTRYSHEYQCIFDKKLADRADLILISNKSKQNFLDYPYLLSLLAQGIPFQEWRTFLNNLKGRIDLGQTDLWSFLTHAPPKSLLDTYYLHSKSVLEPILASGLLLVTWPLFFLIAIGIRLSGPGPIFYLQKRTGFRGRVFKLIKFRTMYIDAEKNGPQWSSQSDNRIYPFGKWLRKTRLDELPQLWNVITRDIQFIGPRPERPEFYNQLNKQIPHFFLRTEIIPGITGWAQVCGGYASSVEESRQKLEYDLFYIQNASMKMDLLVIYKTFKLFLSSILGSLVTVKEDVDSLSQPLEPVLKRSMDR